MSLKSELTLDVIDTHTEGEPTRIIFWNDIPKNLPDALSVRNYFIQHYDYIRTTLLQEPRGHKDQFGAVLLPPVNPGSNYTVIYPTTDSYLDMCGHATIGVSTALVALGYVEYEGSEKVITYDTVAGTVKARVRVENGEPVSVSIVDVKSYFVKKISIDIEGKSIPVNISYGGNFYAIVESDSLGIGVEPANIGKLLEYGKIIREKSKQTIREMYRDSKKNLEPLAMITDSRHDYRAVVTFAGNSFDRSPCGTGTAARAALLVHDGKLDVNGQYTNESIIGSRFTCRIISSEKVNGNIIIVPEITGRAWITQLCKIIVNPEDPLKHGFLVQ
ncbi:MAG: proline racemase family protein [Ferroplasma sp.]|uniref:proline racemase family protein n=1 Tax=Ferroplasma sp. TaxID=2591003 RepID=UPI002815D5AA|nr:proline racemase family protein [Ferroplasma sp.]WMT51683.1 MAG: proline racemase family protein [Ferroplasma sp.]